MATIKKIVCPKCRAKLKFDLDKFTFEVIKFKCPGCASVLRIKNPNFSKEAPPSTATDKAEQETKLSMDDLLAPTGESKSKIEIPEKTLDSLTEDIKEDKPAAKPEIPEKTEEDIPAAQKTLSGQDHDPLIPDDKLVNPTRQIVCPKCKAKLKFDLDKFTSEVIKFKCPGCASALSTKNPNFSKEVPPSSPPSTEEQETKLSMDDLLAPTGESKSKIEIPEKTLDSLTEDIKEDKPAAKPEIPDKTEENIPAAEKPLAEHDHGPWIPDDKLVTPEEQEDSILEDYDSDKLRGYEEGEAEAGDLEWTRYADKKGPQIPKSKIDLNVIPASDTGLQDTLADLQQSEVYNAQGEANLEKNLVKQALRDFNHALEINPNYVDALVNRGSAFVLQSEFNAALADFNHALDLEGRQAEIYNIRGEIYLLNKMYDQALKDFTAAIILNPMYSDAYLNRAKAYNEKGMKEEADKDFNEALKADPDKFTSYVDAASTETLFDEDTLSDKEIVAEHLQQGLEYLKNEKYYEAVENFTEVINLSADNAQAYINRGQAYVELAQHDEAMVDLNRAVLYDPLNPSLYYWRAKAWKGLDSPINMVADLKLSCELGYGPACEEYEKQKPQKH